MIYEFLADRIVSLDIEGDGGKPSLPIEVGICEAYPDMGKLREWKIRPIRRISPFATKIHGLRNSHLNDAPIIEEVSEEILSSLQGALIVGHAVRDDLRCLERSIPSLPRFNAVDTLPMSRQLIPGLPSYSLTTVAGAMGITIENIGRGPHSAGYDARVGAELFLRLCLQPGAETYLRGTGFPIPRTSRSFSP